MKKCEICDGKNLDTQTEFEQFLFSKFQKKNLKPSKKLSLFFLPRCSSPGAASFKQITRYITKVYN